MEDRSLQLGKDRLWLRVGEGGWRQGWPEEKEAAAAGRFGLRARLQSWLPCRSGYARATGVMPASLAFQI